MQSRCVIIIAALAIVAFGVRLDAAEKGEGIVFASWNLQHYRTTPLEKAGLHIPAKTETSLQAVTKTLLAIAPDILGVSEMGSMGDLKALQKTLDREGLKLPYLTMVEGNDSFRHLALLSRFPIRETRHDSESSFESGGERYRVRRGFLDCVVDVSPNVSLHIVGAHLKSRRIESGLDQEEIRRFEGKLLRRRVEAILAGEPNEPLLVFGDFNDTKNSSTVREMLGRKGAKDGLTLLPLTDKVGDQWTYHWAETDEYSRIDFLMVNETLRRWIDPRGSRIYRTPAWRKASDHRPLVTTIKLPTEVKTP